MKAWMQLVSRMCTLYTFCIHQKKGFWSLCQNLHGPAKCLVEPCLTCLVASLCITFLYNKWHDFQNYALWSFFSSGYRLAGTGSTHVRIWLERVSCSTSYARTFCVLFMECYLMWWWGSWFLPDRNRTGKVT